MKTLPDEKTLLALLEEVKNAEIIAREICDKSTEITLKYQRRMREIREARQQGDRR